MLPPSRGPNRTYLIGAEVLLDQAKEYQEILGPLSLGETFIADLEANIATYERLTAEAHDGQLGHVEARSGIQETLAECLDIVAVLDGFNEARLAENAAVLDTWKSARNVFGPFRSPEIDTDDDADEDDEVLIDNAGPSEAAA
ncbi:MAG TPA: hypothetical protein VFN22_12970 [Gemmatimonadales bacterium]|nr:hypothetical protein [Gemmatimonadales bacterium]